MDANEHEEKSHAKMQVENRQIHRRSQSHKGLARRPFVYHFSPSSLCAWREFLSSFFGSLRSFADINDLIMA
jgi:hypothetical protein